MTGEVVLIEAALQCQRGEGELRTELYIQAIRRMAPTKEA